FHLLELELVGPNDHRSPDELVQHDDQRNHRPESPQNGAGVTIACRRLEKGAEPWQPEIAVPQNKHFAGHQEEPPTRDGHHRIPHQANRREWQIQFNKLLPRSKAKDACGLSELARYGLERRIKAERDVPDLARKN